MSHPSPVLSPRAATVPAATEVCLCPEREICSLFYICDFEYCFPHPNQFRWLRQTTSKVVRRLGRAFPVCLSVCPRAARGPPAAPRRGSSAPEACRRARCGTEHMRSADTAAQRLTECLSRGRGLRPSIDRACAGDVCAALLFRLMHSTAVLATPIIVFFLLEWFVDDSQPEWPGYCFAAGFGAVGLIAACAHSCSLRCSLAS